MQIDAHVMSLYGFFPLNFMNVEFFIQSKKHTERHRASQLKHKTLIFRDSRLAATIERNM